MKYSTGLFSVLIGVACMLPLKAQEWTAGWIWQGADGPNNTWLALRKTFTLPQKPASAPTRIAAENKYRLYVNGVLAVRDGGLDIRPDLSNTYFDEVDLAPFMAQGENTVAALVWHKGGSDGYSQITADHGGFLFESRPEGTSAIVSDGSWKIRVHPAFQPTAQMQQWNDWKWVAWPVSFDARSDISGWEAPGYADNGWAGAVVKGVPPAAPWNRLVPRTIPLWKDYGLTDYLNTADLPSSVTADTSIIGQLGINIQGTPFLKVHAPAGVNIRIVLNEFYWQDYTTRAGIQEFECFAWQNSSSHTVAYEFTGVSGPVEIQGLKFRQTGYNTEVLGRFESSDADLNTLWTKCRNTSQVCMRDIFYDCPNRERGQWWGDVSEQILYSFYLYDTSSVLLARKAYRELLATQKPDGSLYTTAPGNKFHLPDQNMAAVALLWKYYQYTADSALLRELYPRLREYIRFCDGTANADGMLVMQPGAGWANWNWIDWGGNMDIVDGSANTVCNAVYIVLLEAMANTAGLLGETADAAWYRELQTAVKSRFNEYFWNAGAAAYVFHNNLGTQSAVIDDRSNAWAVLAGMADSSRRDGVLTVLKARHDASPYQEMYVEGALAQLDPRAALARMRTRFSAMIDSWSSTLWEEFPANNSNNHAWSAGPLYVLSAAILGVAPSRPGYDEYGFFPRSGGLRTVSAAIPAPQGVIEAGFSQGGARFTQTLVSPGGTVAHVGIPQRAFGGYNAGIRRVTANGMVVWENGAAVGNLNGLSFDGADDEYIRFRVQPGTWEFAAAADGAPNLALGQTVSAGSSLENAAWGRANTVDGIRTGTAASNGYTSNPPSGSGMVDEWIEIDLGQEIPIDRVVLYPRTDTYAAGGLDAGFPVDFTIQAKTEAGVMTTVYTAADLPNPQGVPQVFDFEPVSVRYVRINVSRVGPPAADDGGNYRLQLTEVEVYCMSCAALRGSPRPESLVPTADVLLQHHSLQLLFKGAYHINMKDLRGVIHCSSRGNAPDAVILPQGLLPGVYLVEVETEGRRYRLRTFYMH